jgi:signal recognition particle receptor subunit beta
MVQINFAQRQVNAKVVYYGPGMSGKTTNLEVVHQRAPQQNRGDLTSISTDGDRTLFFDFMPLDLGTVAGMRTCFQIYTVPGQVYYNSTRKLVLQGVDGVVFVADSSSAMVEENLESLRNLEENLKEYGKSLATLPHVIQYNKRDLPDALPVDQLNQLLNRYNAPCFEAIANTGQGVFPTLKALAARVLESIHQASAQGGRAPAAAPAPAAPARAAQQPQPAAMRPRMEPAAPIPQQAPMQAPAQPMHVAAQAQPMQPMMQAGYAQPGADPMARTQVVHGMQPGAPAPMQQPMPMQYAAPQAPMPVQQQPMAVNPMLMQQQGYGAQPMQTGMLQQQPMMQAMHPQNQALMPNGYQSADGHGAQQPNGGLQLARTNFAQQQHAGSYTPVAQQSAPPPSQMMRPEPPRPAQPQPKKAQNPLEGTRFRPRMPRPEPQPTPVAKSSSKVWTGAFVGLALVVGGLVTWLLLSFF